MSKQHIIMNVPIDVRGPSSHFGEVCSRYDLVLEYVWRTNWESVFGVVNLHKFVDPDGNIFVWKTGKMLQINNTELELGSHIYCRATVKEHEERESEKQTIITRVDITGLVEQEKLNLHLSGAINLGSYAGKIRKSSRGKRKIHMVSPQDTDEMTLCNASGGDVTTDKELVTCGNCDRILNSPLVDVSLSENGKKHVTKRRNKKLYECEEGQLQFIEKYSWVIPNTFREGGKGCLVDLTCQECGNTHTRNTQDVFQCKVCKDCKGGSKNKQREEKSTCREHQNPEDMESALIETVKNMQDECPVLLDCYTDTELLDLMQCDGVTNPSKAVEWAIRMESDINNM